MKIIYDLGLVCMLMGSCYVARAMELQLDESQEIAVARAKALLELGKMLVESKDYEKAREYLEEAATQATDKARAVAARVELGELYYKGFGVEIDYEKAYEYFVQPANQKEDLQALIVACQYLGEMYLLGRGVEKDYQKAGVYFQLLSDPEIKEAGFSVSSIVLKQWRLIEPQLERVDAINRDVVKAAKVREKIIAENGKLEAKSLIELIHALDYADIPLLEEIIVEYGKLDARSLIELIHALDYADIPLLLEIACNVVKQSDLGRFNFEQINSLPEDMRNRIILGKILALCGPMPARELAVVCGNEESVSSVCVTKDDKIVSGSWDKTARVLDMQGKLIGHMQRP